jgi:hypothetical protein
MEALLELLRVSEMEMDSEMEMMETLGSVILTSLEIRMVTVMEMEVEFLSAPETEKEME